MRIDSGSWQEIARTCGLAEQSAYTSCWNWLNRSLTFSGLYRRNHLCENPASDVERRETTVYHLQGRFENLHRPQPTNTAAAQLSLKSECSRPWPALVSCFNFPLGVQNPLWLGPWRLQAERVRKLKAAQEAKGKLQLKRRKAVKRRAAPNLNIRSGIMTLR